MNIKTLKKSFIWSKGTRGYKVFKTSLKLFIFTQLVYYMIIGVIAFIALQAHNFTNTKPNAIMKTVLTINVYWIAILIILNIVYVLQVCERVKLFKRVKSYKEIMYGTVIKAERKNKGYRQIIVLSEQKGRCSITVYDKNIYGRNPANKGFIAIPYRFDYFIAYY